MGKRSTRKPTHLKVVQGTARADRMNAAEPKLEPGVPDMPPTLGEYGQAVWGRMIGHLQLLGILTVVDLELLAVYCGHAETAENARQIVNAEGLVVDGKKNPAQMVREKCLAEMRLILPEFGLTPASRGKVSSLTVDEENPLRKLMK